MRVRLGDAVTCPTCKGSGTVPGLLGDALTCPGCNGVPLTPAGPADRLFDAPKTMRGQLAMPGAQ